jgi:4a-hydroxytetrahydrobiopterin dehydratase
MSDALDADTVRAEVARRPGWDYDGEAIGRTFDRGDFNGSMAFVNAVAAAANHLDHHPDIALSWNEVTIRTSSHDLKGISPRDLALIDAIDRL